MMDIDFAAYNGPTIYTSLNGQVYFLEEFSSFDTLNASQQHMYRNCGCIDMVPLNASNKVYHLHEHDEEHIYTEYIVAPNYFDVVIKRKLKRKRIEQLWRKQKRKHPDPKPKLTGKNIFDDDDWDTPLMNVEASKINRFNTRENDGISLNTHVDDMTMDDCIVWLEKYEAEYGDTYKADNVRNRLYSFRIKIEREEARKIMEYEMKVEEAKSFHFPKSMNDVFVDMFLHQDEWWESKQIRYNGMLLNKTI